MLKKVAIAYVQWCARFVLKIRRPVIVGVTGSVGKSTTVDLIHAVLSQKAAKSIGSVGKTHNNMNDDGLLPLAILGFQKRLPKNVSPILMALSVFFRTIGRLFSCPRVLVLEFGAGSGGHLHELARIAPPTVAVITAVGPAHLEHFKTVSRVADEKSALIRSVAPKGLVILGEENPYITEMWTLSVAPVKTVTGRGIKLSENIAREVAEYFGLSTDIVAQAMKEFKRPGRRLETLRIGQLTIINDSYNANPMSMRLALDFLMDHGRDNQRRVAILGAMAELGPHSESYHKEIGQHARTRSDFIAGVGELAAYYAPDVCYASSDEITAALPTIVRLDDRVLIKGSAVLKLNIVAKTLRAHVQANGERAMSEAEKAG